MLNVIILTLLVSLSLKADAKWACVDLFNRSQFSDELNKAKVYESYETGFYGKSMSLVQKELLVKHKDGQSRQTRKVYVSKPILEFNKVTKTQIIINQNNYSYVSLPLGIFKKNLNLFHLILRKHLIKFFEENLKVVYMGKAWQQLKFFADFRLALNEAVLKIYQNKKSYLDKVDQFFLHEDQKAILDGDVFAIYDDSSSIKNLSREKMSSKVKATVQLSYGSTDFFNYNYIFSDFVFTKKNSLPEPVLYSGDGRKLKYIKLPFYDRIFNTNNNATEQKINETIGSVELAKKFQTDFGDSKIAEINRFARLDNKLPQQASDFMLYQLFKTAEKKKIKYIFASTDSFTKRLFQRQYGFKEYIQLVTGSSPEFLIYIEVGSAEYKQMIDRLQNSATQVQQVSQSAFAEF